MKKLIVIFAALVTFASTAFAQLGSAASDLVFTPITPCRVLDTRSSQGGTGSIPAAGTKHFTIWGAASYAAQGGSPTNCGINAGADVAAVAMNFTVVTPAAGGFITAYPFGGAVPVAATVNFQAGDIARGDFTIAKVAQTGTSHLSIYSTSLLDVVGDVVGFYSRPVATALNCTTVYGATKSVAAGAYTVLATLTCPANYTPVNLSFNAQENVVLADTYFGGAQGQMYVRSFSAFVQNVTPNMTCCQIPGR